MITNIKKLALTVSFLAIGAANAAHAGTAHTDGDVADDKTAASYDVDVSVGADKTSDASANKSATPTQDGDVAVRKAAEYDVNVDAGVEETASSKLEKDSEDNLDVTAMPETPINALEHKANGVVKLSGTIQDVAEKSFILSDGSHKVTINTESADFKAVSGQKVMVVGQVDSGVFGDAVKAKQIVTQ